MSADPAPSRASDTPIRILLADDHAVVRSGVRLLLDAQSDMPVVGEASDGLEVIHLTEQMHPDVVLLDISMQQLPPPRRGAGCGRDGDRGEAFQAGAAPWQTFASDEWNSAMR